MVCMHTLPQFTCFIYVYVPSSHHLYNTCYDMQHTIDFYVPLVYRSYLEREDKYTIPNQRNSKNQVTDVDALRPKVTESEIHEYPNEKVIVLQGENLWFSYKVCLDEKGPNECEFSTLPENTTQCRIEFRADSMKCFAVNSSKQVKLTLYTHFASSIRQPIDIRKVCTYIYCSVFV